MTDQTITPEQALQNLAALIYHDSLRFPNHRERTAFDQSLVTLGSLIEEHAAQQTEIASLKKQLKQTAKK